MSKGKIQLILIEISTLIIAIIDRNLYSYIYLFISTLRNTHDVLNTRSQYISTAFDTKASWRAKPKHNCQQEFGFIQSS